MTKRLDSSRGQKFAVNVELEAKLKVSADLEAKTLVSVSRACSRSQSRSQVLGLGLNGQVSVSRLISSTLSRP